MKNENLLEAIRNRVSLTSPWGKVAADKIIKGTYGIDPAMNSFTSATSDQIFNLIENASKRSAEFIRPNSTRHDQADELAIQAFQVSNSKNMEIHPMDEAFLILKDAVKLSSDEEKLIDDLKNSGKLDPVDSFVQNSFVSNANTLTAKHHAADLYDLISEIYQMKCPDGKTEIANDPVNDYVKGVFGNGRFPEQPGHTLAQWKQLIEEATGLNPEADIFARSEDSTNDLAAKTLGLEPPSVKALEILTSKVMDATYQIAYKLTPGTEAYNKKVEERDKLQIARKKREDNLKEIED